MFQLCVLPFCPESPSFLIKQVGGSSLALSTLRKLHRAESAAMHMNNLKSELQEGGKTGDDMSIGELLMAKHLRKQVLVGIVIKIGVQFSGIDAIFYYSTLMFRHAKVHATRPTEAAWALEEAAWHPLWWSLERLRRGHAL